MTRNPRAEAVIDGLAELGETLDRYETLPTYEIDLVCRLCGAREIRATRNPNAPATQMHVCRRCTGGEA